MKLEMASNQLLTRPLRISLKDNINDTLAQISLGSKTPVVNSNQSNFSNSQTFDHMKNQSHASTLSFSSIFSERESLTNRMITSISPDTRVQDQTCSQSLRINLFSATEPSFNSNQCTMTDRNMESYVNNRPNTSRISLLSSVSQQGCYSERSITKPSNVVLSSERSVAQLRGPLLENNQNPVFSQTCQDFESQVRTSESQKIFYSHQDLTKTNEETPQKSQVTLNSKSSYYSSNSVSISPSKAEAENVERNLGEALSNPRKSNLKGSMRSHRSSMKGPGKKGPKRTVNFMEKHETIAVSKYIGKEDDALSF